MLFFFFKQKTAYEMRISDWSSDVCSSDLRCVDCARYSCRRRGRYDRHAADGAAERGGIARGGEAGPGWRRPATAGDRSGRRFPLARRAPRRGRDWRGPPSATDMDARRDGSDGERRHGRRAPGLLSYEERRVGNGVVRSWWAWGTADQ